MNKVRITQMANKYLNYDMIGLHTELPEFPSGRISLLNSFLSHQPRVASQKDLLSVVTSLVQMGLDTHDLVENSPNPAKSGILGMRAQQLKVLAGDYFSSRFYSLLAQAGEIEMIRHLSEAICNINQTKMKVYSKMKQMKLNAEEYLHYGAELRSQLFLSFASFMGGLYEHLWPELLGHFSRCEVLLQELRKLESMSSLEDSWGVWHILQEGTEEDRRHLIDRREDPNLVITLLNKYDIADKLGGLLRQSTDQLQVLLQKIQSDKLLQELQPLIEPFLQATGSQRATALKELG